MAETVKGRPKDGSPSSTSRVRTQRLKSDKNTRLSANTPAKAAEAFKVNLSTQVRLQVTQHTGVQLSVGRTLLTTKRFPK